MSEKKLDVDKDPARSEVRAADVAKEDRVNDNASAANEQFPSLVGKPDVEVSERTTDAEKAASPVHVKTFVTPKATWGTEDQDEVHKRNVNAVRQSMVNQGLRPDADVVFAGERDYGDGFSIALDYEVRAVPAAIAAGYNLRHTVVAQNGEQATDQVERDQKRVELQRDHFREVQDLGVVPTEKDVKKK